jgi:ABC-type antimicrobial peptide transport system permease subunit
VIGQRTLEVGIRVAIGARPGQVARMLLIQSLWPVFLGVAIGALGGVGLGRLLNSMFWKMTSAEPAVLAGIAALMLMVAVGAAVTPIRRVLRLDPQFLLRNE